MKMDFVNLTPYTAEVQSPDGDLLHTVDPSGAVALAAGDPPQLINVPDPQDGVAYIVLPAITEASDRPDLVSVEVDEAQRSRRGNVHTHVCYWPKA